MADDPFQDLLSLEDEFYSEGYEAGIADSAYAGMIEGKLFGIEKGYEKCLELAKFHGRALVWQARGVDVKSSESSVVFDEGPLNDSNRNRIDGHEVATVLKDVNIAAKKIHKGRGLQNKIDTFLSLSDGSSISPENSDQAVSDFDDRLVKVRAKAKIIASLAEEPLTFGPSVNSGIEDATGLSARH